MHNFTRLVLVLLAVLLLSVANPASAQDPTDPAPIDLGDITALPQPAFRPARLTGDAAAVQTYQFTLTAAQAVGLGLRQQDADADLYLAEVTGTERGRSAAAGTAPEWIQATLLAGTYTVRVEAREAGENQYVLRYGVSAPDADEVARLEAERDADADDDSADDDDSAEDTDDEDNDEDFAADTEQDSDDEDADDESAGDDDADSAEDTDEDSAEDTDDEDNGEDADEDDNDEDADGEDADNDEEADDPAPIDLGDITALPQPAFRSARLAGAAAAVQTYQFTLTAAQAVGLGVRQQDADADLYLADTTGTERGRSEAAGTAKEWIQATLLAGTYTVRVEAREAGENQYVLRYGVSAPDADEVARLEAEQDSDEDADDDNGEDADDADADDDDADNDEDSADDDDGDDNDDAADDNDDDDAADDDADADDADLAAARNTVATDKAALVALYNATDGANWTTNTNWTSDASLSSWHGVTTNSDGRVTELELDGNGLSGTLPTELGDLTELASLRLNGNVYLAGPLPAGLRELSALATVDLADTELCAPEDDAFQTWLDAISFSGLICPPKSQTVIDVAVFYTPAARDAAGGTAAIEAEIDLMAAETNLAYRASGVNQRIALAAVEEVEYTAKGATREDIDRLQDPSDGHMDEVHTTRDQVAADIVVLIVIGHAGIAYDILTPANASAANAFATSGVNSRIFAHELGHLMGLAHDRYVACVFDPSGLGGDGCSEAATAYAYGYVNQQAFEEDAPVSARWRTVMAYDSQCHEAGCPQLLRFSNPDQIYPDPGGDPLGVAGREPSTALDGPADAVRTLNRTRATVANFRTPTAVTVSFGAAAYTAAEGGEAATVTVNLSPVPGRPVSIPLVSVGATGATASDYTAPRSVAFAATETAQTFTVTAVDDDADDDGETVTLAFDTRVLPSGMTVGSPATATVTLTDDDLVTGGPSVSAVSLTSDPGPDAIYALGDEIEATVRFDKSVTVTGTPQLGLTVGSGTRQMTHRGGGGEVLTFAYTVAEDDSDTDGVSIAADSLSGTIRDSANENAILTHVAVEADAGHRVDGVRPLLQGAVADGNRLTLTYAEALHEGSLTETQFHAPDAFTVTSGGNAVRVDQVAVMQQTVRLDLSGWVLRGDAVTVSYSPGANPIRDAAGNEAAAFSDRSATNETPQPHYDTDHDGLIEITTLAQLDAVRHDLDGDGTPGGVIGGPAVYRAAFPLAFPDEQARRLGCHAACIGYELLADLDFLDVNGDGRVDTDDDTNGDGRVAADDTTWWHGGAGWDPIRTGGQTSYFAEFFEGNGHAIRHLFINRPAKHGVGLFANSSSNIRNVGVIEIDVTGNTAVGGLVGINTGRIEASYATGPVSGTTNVGGLVGLNYGNGRITTSYATGPVSGEVQVGGLVGYANGRITTSYATGPVSGTTNVGGLVGESEGCRITTSYATGPVSGEAQVGGLVGRNTGRIEASYATGPVSGTINVGGLVGLNYNGRITTSYATGPVSGKVQVGGLVGLSSSGEINASYWDTTTSGQATGSNGQGQTTTQLQTPTGYSGIYADWNVDLDGDGTNNDPWDFGEADEYPVLAVDFDGNGDTTWQEFGYQLRESPPLTVTTDTGLIVLSWDAVTPHWTAPPAVTYTVYRTTGSIVEAVAEDLPDPEYTDLAVTRGTTYTYQVAAVVNGGKATWSGLVTVTAPNQPPMFDDGTSAERSIAENTTGNIGLPITATDPDADTLTYSLSGTDANDFSINTSTGQLRTTAALDYETKDTYHVTVSVHDGTPDTTIDATLAVTIRVTDVAEQPARPGAPSVTATANTTDSLDVSWAAPGTDGGPALTGYELRYRKGTSEPWTAWAHSGTGTSTTITGLDAASEHQVQVRALNGETPGEWSDSGTGTTGTPNNAPTFCSGGMAGTSPCSNVDLMSVLALADIGGGEANDIWGWTDSSTGKEYAIMGRTNGTSFVHVSDPLNPIYLGNLPPHSTNSIERDIKVYADHAFIVTEANNSGMQVFDLTQLRSVASPPATFSETAHYPGFSDAHNLAINEDSGFAYAVGTNTCSGGLHMINIQTPTNPTSAGCFSADGYTHDAQCVNYAGPDNDHQGKEICLNSNEDTLTIVDVTDKAAPAMLSRTDYSGSRYTHQGWLTEDHAYFLLDDELDEKNNPDVTNTRTYMWDVSDLDDPALIGSHDSTTTAIDHNQYVKGKYTYQSNYQAGLRILDITDIANGNLSEAAFFDFNPGSDPTNTGGGTWSNYPFFDSGIVIVSVIEQGLFILRPNLVDGVNPALASAAVNGAALTLIYGEALDESSTPATDAFTVTVAGSGRTVIHVSVRGRVVTLTLASAVTASQEVTLTYSVPGTNPIQDLAGNASQAYMVTVTRTAAPNQPPTFPSTETGRRSIPEHTTGNIGLPVTATDPDADSLTYSLDGTDAAAFSLNPSTGQLQTAAALDYETKDTYYVTVSVTDGTSDATVDVTITVTDMNEAPTFDAGTSTTRSVTENTAAGQDIGNPVTATDPDTRTPAYAALTYWLSESDAGVFLLDADSGQLRTREPLDHESRNAYQVTVHVRDGNGTDDSTDEDDTIRVRIEVGNVDEAGMVELSSTEPQEKQALTAMLSDPDGRLSGISWQWARTTSRSGPGTPIPGATTTRYTPGAADVGHYVRATATYTDGYGTEKDESATTTAQVRAAPQVLLALSSSAITEKNGVSTVTATLTPAVSVETRVTVAATAVSPAVSGDFTLRGSTLTIRAYQTSSEGTVTLTARDNDVDGPQETKAVTVTGTVPSNSPVTAPAEVTLTITDEDTRGVTVTPTALSVNEGASADYTVVLTSQPTAAVTVTVTAPANPDVTVNKPALTFQPGSWHTAQTVTVEAAEDTGAEDEAATITHTVSGGDYDGETVADVEVTVEDDEAPSTAVQLTVSRPASATVSEGAGRTTVTVTGTLNGATRVEETEVSVSVAPGTAAQGTDFTAAPATFPLTIAPNTKSGTAPFALTPAHDTIDEPNETLTVSGSTTVGLTVTPTTVTITDNDPAPTVRLEVADTRIREGGTTRLTARLLNGTSSAATEITVTAPAGTFRLSPNPLTIAPGGTLSSATLTAEDNNLDAQDRRVTVTGVVANTQGVGQLKTTTLTITDDDPPVVDGETTLSYTERDTHPVATYTATNPANVRLVWAVAGLDAAAFAIDRNGMLGFDPPPDFERPQDVGEDNVYQVTVEAADETSRPGVSLTGRLAVIVTVEDAPGEVKLPPTAPQIGTPFTATLDDPDGVGVVTDWCWARSLFRDPPPADPSTLRIDCDAQTTASYTPLTADVGHYLRATATYTDSDGTPNKEAAAVSVVVGTSPPPPPPEPVGALENPGPASFQSGIGLLSGWVCAADVVELEIDGGPRIAAAYGTDRADTAPVCGDRNNGFGLLFNWNLLGDGDHTVVAVADGVAFGRATFTVTTLGEEVLEGGQGETVVADFPTPGEAVRLVWQQAQQNFVLAPLDRGPPPTSPPRPAGGPPGSLENPGPASFQSGIGLLSGWVCNAAVVELEINGGARLVAAYGTDRADTAPVCGDRNNGFGLLFNWNLLGDGIHTVRAVADGEEFGRATFTVTTLGVEFLQGTHGEAVVADFPSPGEAVRLIWQQAQQNFVLAPVQ